MAAVATGTWLCTGVRQRPATSASLSLAAASRATTPASVSLKSTAPGFLRCSFVSASSPLSSISSSSFSGSSLGLSFNINTGVSTGRRRVLVVRAGKAALCQTKRSRSRKSLARTHGFRRRMRTTSGRALLKRRRAKGRHNLCTKTNPYRETGLILCVFGMYAVCCR
ncbi:PREDICTED: 50S ribosomal protein L34, chloroplastic isoform X1 [Ipomoea nil]|uniref:50S ribosomal protein L34, chloroplastic isoform X1 n=1 Tax=Ipomoea nil TaxID=35883 RepID=UPI000900AF03|nr:PREDICTED: 50S ribosomal protein L34, chloroplastic isoform X1 [Ipomoea nil]